MTILRSDVRTDCQCLGSQVGWSGVAQDVIIPTQNGVQLKTYELFMSGIFLFEISRP